MLALGIDVAANRALDCVLMSGVPGELRVEEAPFTCRPADLADAINRLGKPDVVGIDSPPKPGIRGKGRQAERDLRSRGIGIFWNPTSWDKPFYGWMKVGRETFAAAAAAGYPLYERGPSVRGRAIEVFPHGSAVVLRDTVWPAGTHRRKGLKQRWRLDALAGAGVDDTSSLSNLDQVDAALAAVTGLYAAARMFTAVGLPDEGVIVLPAKRLPPRYPKEQSAAR